jgi:hypothetical protein
MSHGSFQKGMAAIMTSEQLAALKEVAEEAIENYAAYGQKFERKFQPATCLALLEEVERLTRENQCLSSERSL